MTARRDPDHLIRTYLDDGPTELPDRSYDAVRTQIDHTRQRVVFGPWREAQLFRYSSFAIGAVAIILVAALGFSLWPRNDGIAGNPSPTPTAASATPTVSPLPTATPSPSPHSLPSGGEAALEAGTYVTGAPFLARLTLTLPGPWTGSIAGPYAVYVKRIGGPELSFQIPGKVVADPCHYDQGVLDVGPSSADLANALASLPGAITTQPTDETIGGYAAKHLTVTAPGSFSGCTNYEGTFFPTFRLWELPLGGTNDMDESETQELWITEVGGQRLVIGTSQIAAKQNGPFEAELQAVLDSIIIAPQN